MCVCVYSHARHHTMYVHILLIVSYVTSFKYLHFLLHALHYFSYILCDPVYIVSFEDLYSLRAPVGTVEGFDISAFDRQVSIHHNVCVVQHCRTFCCTSLIGKLE